MFLISFISKVLRLSAIISIILTLVSTEIKVYQMVKKKENYVSYLSRPVVSPEVKLTMKDFYLTKYNLEQKIIPPPFKRYDYDLYQRKLSYYCAKTYLTFDLFTRKHHITLFRAAVFNLKTRLKNNTSEQFDDEIKTAFGIRLIDEDYTPQFIPSINRLSSCIAKMYINVTKENEDESSDTTDSDDSEDGITSCFDIKFNDNSTDAQKYKQYVLNNLKGFLSTKHWFEMLICIRIFKTKYYAILPNIIPGNPGFLQSQDNDKPTVKELLLVHSIVLNMRNNSKIIDIQNLFHVIYQLKKTKLSNDEFKNCKKNLKAMDLVPYTLTKLSYLLLPAFPIEDSNKTFSEYEIKRRMIVENLMAIDFKNKPFYSKLLNINGQFNRNDFSKLIRRRAIKFETKYNSYAMRIMYLSEYLPLPRNLWDYERKNSDNKYIQEFISEEQKTDLESYRSYIDFKYFKVTEVPEENIQE